jgi:hypothetical protein
MALIQMSIIFEVFALVFKTLQTVSIHSSTNIIFLPLRKGRLIANQTFRLEVQFYVQTNWCARRDSNPEPSDP